jgi:hypothetical protein
LPRQSIAARARPLAILLVALATVLSVGTGQALARGGGNKTSAASGLSLLSEFVTNSPNPAAPTWCLNEDDYHQRNWSGSLNGSSTASERLCDPSVDYSQGMWWDAGGIGLQADIYVVGALTDVAITSPSGDSHHAVLVGSSTSKGVTTDHYQVCYVPPYSTTYDIGGTPLQGGTWTITVSGSITKANYSLTARMADVTFQQQNCPASERNLFS